MATGPAASSASRVFPAGFLWGTASAAYQVEGGNHNADWREFEEQPGRIANGDRAVVACDHYNRFREDFELLKELANNAHRLSIEWSRVEPTRGRLEARELEHYRQVLSTLRELGMRPMVTLSHFTAPIWFARAGGWAAAGADAAFTAFATGVVEACGDLVDLWCTINEPNIHAFNGWFVGEFPPGRRGDLVGLYRALGNMRRAHEELYRWIKERRPEAEVGLSHHEFLLMPASARWPDRAAAGLAQGFMDRWPAGRGRLRETLSASSDYIGIAHYWGQSVAFDPRRPGSQFTRRSNPPGAVMTDMGWPSDPAWMRRILLGLRRHRKPIYITENGISTADDEKRQRYLKDVLSEVQGAIEEGADVRGYFHWTSMDNFEWARGFGQRFGLIAVDRQTMARTVKPSGRLYGRIAAANALVD